LGALPPALVYLISVKLFVVMTFTNKKGRWEVCSIVHGRGSACSYELLLDWICCCQL